MRHLLFLSILLAPALSAQALDESFFKGDPKQVIQVCADRLMALKPKEERDLAQIGRAYLVAGNADRAREILGRVGRTDGQALRWAAQGWLEAGDSSQGLATMAALSTLGNSANNEMRDGAVLLMDLNFPKEGESLMSRAFQVAPRDWQNLTAFARAYLRRQHPELAAQWFVRAVESRRNSEGLWMEIAQSVADQGAER